jgi:hypothetical protein
MSVLSEDKVREEEKQERKGANRFRQLNCVPSSNFSRLQNHNPRLLRLGSVQLERAEPLIALENVREILAEVGSDLSTKEVAVVLLSSA